MSARDARRAIVIDFEGRKAYEPAPDLIGIYDPFEAPGARFYQVILSDVLAPAAKAGDGHRVESLPSLLERLVDRAEAERARIVSFSQHDLGMIRKHVGKEDPDFYRRFRRVYRDVNARAKRWVNSNGYVPLMPPGDDFNLQRYLEFTGFRCRKNHREADVSLTLRAMHKHIRAGQPYRKLKKRTKRHWHDVLGTTAAMSRGPASCY